MSANARLFALLLAVLAVSMVGCKHPQTARTVDPYIDGSGSDIAARVQSVIDNEKLCPNVNSATSRGCVIDLSHPECVNESCNPATSRDLIFLTNPTHGKNKGVVFRLGSYTYIACQPIVDGQNGYFWDGVNSPAQISNRSILRAGSVADGCPVKFPGGNTSPIVMSYQHGPFPAGTYYALLTQGGQTSTDSPTTQRGDTFGSRVTNLQLDGNGLADFVYFSPTVEERSILNNVSFKNCGVAGTRPWACAFYDRQYQSGPSSGGGSGPSHAGMQDVVATMARASTDTSGVTVNPGVGFAIVQELGTTFVEFDGDRGPYGEATASAYGCTAATDPKQSYLPTAYATQSSGVPNQPVLTNAGNCTTPPKSCKYLSDSGLVFSPLNVCAVTSTGKMVTSISFPTPGGNYPGAQVPAGGLWLERATFTGIIDNGTILSWRDAMWFEGVYELGLYGPVHTERVSRDAVHYGDGSSPNAGGTIMGVSTTLGPDGCAVHFGNGFLDNSYTAISTQREISNGNIVCDDNVRSGSTFALNTSDSRRIPLYSGRSTYTKFVQLTAGEFADLPPCQASNEGMGAAVTDSTTNTYNAAIAGGGKYHTHAYCDGISWKAK